MLQSRYIYLSKYLRDNIKYFIHNKRNIVNFINSDFVNYDNNNIITSSSSSSGTAAGTAAIAVETITTTMNSNDIGIGSQVKFPWSQFIIQEDGIFYMMLKNITNYCLQDFLSNLKNKNNACIINFNVITINSMNLFKEATMSIFQHELMRLHQSNSKQSISFDNLDSDVTATTTTTTATTNSIDDNSISSDHSNNTSCKIDINNDPFPLSFIFESKLAGLYQHAIERYCMNPNLSIHYQLHEIKSSSIYDVEIFLGIMNATHTLFV